MAHLDGTKVACFFFPLPLSVRALQVAKHPGGVGSVRNNSHPSRRPGCPLAGLLFEHFLNRQWLIGIAVV